SSSARWTSADLRSAVSNGPPGAACRSRKLAVATARTIATLATSRPTTNRSTAAMVARLGRDSRPTFVETAAGERLAGEGGGGRYGSPLGPGLRASSRDRARDATAPADRPG